MVKGVRPEYIEKLICFIAIIVESNNEEGALNNERKKTYLFIHAITFDCNGSGGMFDW